MISTAANDVNRTAVFFACIAVLRLNRLYAIRFNFLLALRARFSDKLMSVTKDHLRRYYYMLQGGR